MSLRHLQTESPLPKSGKSDDEESGPSTACDLASHAVGMWRNRLRPETMTQLSGHDWEALILEVELLVVRVRDGE